MKTPPHRALRETVSSTQAGQAGIEPATYGFGDRCSAKLSYWPVRADRLLVDTLYPPRSAISYAISSLDEECEFDNASSICSTPYDSDRCADSSQKYSYVRCTQCRQESLPNELLSWPLVILYSRILVMTPDPTVRPPSRMANREPASNATGTINVTFRFTLSPGITISTPSASSTAPVTSNVPT